MLEVKKLDNGDLVLTLTQDQALTIFASLRFFLHERNEFMPPQVRENMLAITQILKHVGVEFDGNSN